MILRVLNVFLDIHEVIKELEILRDILDLLENIDKEMINLKFYVLMELTEIKLKVLLCLIAIIDHKDFIEIKQELLIPYLDLLNFIEYIILIRLIILAMLLYSQCLDNYQIIDLL